MDSEKQPTESATAKFSLDKETLRLVYQEACKNHGAIADFRGKLLGLLPVASGSGVFILLGTLNNQTVLAPIGLFGVAVTLGLFVYELRGIEDCTMLRRRAAEIELGLGIPKQESVFHNWKRGKLGLLDEIGASWIVYSAVLLSWAYLAGVGAQARWDPLPQPLPWPWALPIIYLVILVLALGPGRNLWPYGEPKKR
jgi:hypothetical protein